MPEIKRQPDNFNMLSPVGFRFVLKRAPTLIFFTENVVLPSLILGSSDHPTPFVKYPVPGDHLDFSELNITFKVDEDLDNYMEIFDWMIALGFPHDFSQYAAIDAETITSGDGIRSDGSLIIESSAMRPNLEVVFEDMFPISLSNLNFSTQDVEIDYLSAEVTFRFTKYTMKTI
jgi:hypothetical protein